MTGFLLFPAALLTLAAPSLAWAHGMSEAGREAMLSGGNLTFLWLGAEHMVTGYDHLLFLLAVIFFLTRAREVVKYVTAFTLGHSLTLLFATLWGISANYFLIDAVIALSICYKGFDNTNGFRRYLTVDPPNLTLAIFIFGLIHGFGLSTRLQQLPLEQSGLIQRILSFNLGVEIGQVLALVVMIFVVRNWRKTESFSRFSSAANNGLIAAGVILFLMQMHGYTHALYPEEFGFNADAHYHAHERMHAETAPSKTLPVLDGELTRALLPSLEEGMPRTRVVHRLGQAWKFRDDAAGILAYGMRVDGSNALVVDATNGTTAPYELVLVFDDRARLKHQSLVKVE